MEYFILFFLIVGILTLVGWLLLWLSGVMAGLLGPIAILLGWLTAHLPLTPGQSALVSTTLLFLLFRVMLLPYWAVYARVNRATGEVLPELVSTSHGGSAGRDWFAGRGGATDPYPTNRVFQRLGLLLLLGGAFYFAVLRATEQGVATWRVSQDILTAAFNPDDHDKRLGKVEKPSDRDDKPPAKKDKRPLLKGDNPFGAFFWGCMFIGLGALMVCALALGLACGTAALVAVVLPSPKGFGASSLVAFVRGHRGSAAVFPLVAAEWVVLCAVLLTTVFFCRDHPFTDYLAGGYALALALYAPIWSAASTLMDWRNDRWVALLVRQLKSAGDREVRFGASAKLANLGPWAPK